MIPETGPRTIDGFSRPADMKAYVDCFHSSSSVVRRETFERYGGYYDRDRCVYGEDSYFWLQVALGERGLFRPQCAHPFPRGGSEPRRETEGPASSRRPALIHPEPLLGELPAGAARATGNAARFPAPDRNAKARRARQVPRHRLAAPRLSLWPAGTSSPMITLREVRVSALRLVNRIASAGDNSAVPN